LAGGNKGLASRGRVVSVIKGKTETIRAGRNVAELAQGKGIGKVSRMGGVRKNAGRGDKGRDRRAG